MSNRVKAVMKMLEMQSMRFSRNRQAKGGQFQVESKQETILLCGRRIFHTEAVHFTVRLVDFYKATGISLLAVTTILRIILLSQTALDQMEFMMAIDLI